MQLSPERLYLSKRTAQKKKYLLVEANSPGTTLLLAYFNIIIGFDILVFRVNTLLTLPLDLCLHLISLNIVEPPDGSVVMADTTSFLVGILGDIVFPLGGDGVLHLRVNKELRIGLSGVKHPSLSS